MKIRGSSLFLHLLSGLCLASLAAAQTSAPSSQPRAAKGADADQPIIVEAAFLAAVERIIGGVEIDHYFARMLGSAAHPEAQQAQAVAGLTVEELAGSPGSEKRKVEIATVVWERTTVDMKWTAEKLHMRSAAHASQQIRRHHSQPPALSETLEKRINQS